MKKKGVVLWSRRRRRGLSNSNSRIKRKWRKKVLYCEIGEGEGGLVIVIVE